MVILILTYTFVSVIASFIPPKFFWGLFFLSYSMPIVLVLNVIALGLYFFIKKHFWLVALSLGISLFGIANNWSWKESTNDGTANYSLMSYNVRLFDLHNRLDGKRWEGWKARTDNGATLDSLYKTITGGNTDFVCLQEYFNQPKGEYQSTKYFQEHGYEHTHIAYAFQDAANQYGIATFSKYPIVHKEIKYFQPLSLNTGVQITDVKISNDTIRIINIHMQSFKLGKADYEYLHALSDSTFQRIDSKPTKELLNKIKLAFIKRSKQLDDLLAIVDVSPHPVLLCGDFNELPNSYLYRSITKKLNDSFQEVGLGFGSTLVSDVPALRIDYIFHSPSIKAVSHQVIDRELSDHYPVLFEFKNPY
jgi:endonuclease/exonuclease/phosphatase family metal-dependent hydrolase